MFETIAIEARSGYRLWIRYQDGSEGEINLTHLVGRGVFDLWEDEDRFRRSIQTCQHRKRRRYLLEQ